MLKIYRSSAGSGKTFTLVKEYLQICMKSREHDKYKHILAITFTNKACNEMKERIIKTLVDFSNGVQNEKAMFETLQKDYGLEPDFIIGYSKKMLEAVLHDYSSFSISTIDSFIHRVIRSFAYELDIPHQFEVHIDKDELIEKVIDNLLSEINETSDSPVVQSLLEYTDRKIDESKGWNIDSALGSFAKDLLSESSLPFLNKLSELDFGTIDAAQQKLQKDVVVFEKQIEKIGIEADELIRRNGIGEEDFFQKGKGIPGYIKKMKSAANGIVSLEYNSYVGKAINEDKWYSGKENTRIDSIKEELRSLILQADSIMSKSGQRYFLNKLVLSNIYQIKVADGISKALQHVKEEENILPILEFQHIISKIVSVQDAPIIYERIGERYDNILIDEFQDTSTLQFQNMLPLIENSQFKSAESLIVGDAKQSIYRFKGGEAMQLVELPKVLGSDKDEMLQAREIAINNYPTSTNNLKSNFRSKREIIQFNNQFYSTIKETNDALKKIYENHEQVFSDDNIGGFVSIEEMEDEEEIRENKCKRILEIIAECKDKGYSSGDVAILTRGNKEAAYYASMLIEEKFEVETGESLLFINSPFVRKIDALIRFASNPLDTVCRYELLKQTDLISKLSSAEISTVLKSDLPDFGDLIARLINGKFDTFGILHYTAYQLAIHAIKLFEIDVKDIFVSSFIDLIADSKHTQPADFIEWWDDVKTIKSIQTNSKKDAIKIMTIHKSKGLQFPIVILPDADWRVKIGSKNFWIENDSDVGISPMLISINKELAKTKYASLLEEEMLLSEIDTINLLYVATTRPEDRLYILYKKNKEDGESIYADNYITYYLRTQPEDNNVYHYGDVTSIKKVKSEKANTQELLSLTQIKISTGNAHQVKPTNETELNHEQQYGNLLHETLSRVADYGIERAILNLATTEEVKLRISADVDFIIYHNDIADYFSNNYERISEHEILSDDKKILKPDLLAIKKGTKNAVIMDYKTGRPMPEHLEQVKQYALLLGRSGYTVERKLIVYTQTKEVHSV